MYLLESSIRKGIPYLKIEAEEGQRMAADVNRRTKGLTGITAIEPDVTEKIGEEGHRPCMREDEIPAFRDDSSFFFPVLFIYLLRPAP